MALARAIGHLVAGARAPARAIGYLPAGARTLALAVATCAVIGCGDDGPTWPTDGAAEAIVADARSQDAAPADRGASPDLARDSLSQDKGQLVGQMWNTYYYVARESDYSGAATVTLYTSTCSPLTQVSAAFSDAVCVEGSGQLKDGRIINYAKTCSCGRPCPTGGIVCYAVLDKAKYPWGMGAASRALVPLRSWAVDKSVIPIGTRLYAAQWDGLKIPSVDGLGGSTHDGCFRADDVGGAIQGMHVDIFAGTKSMWLALEKLVKTKSSLTVYKNPGRCSYLPP